METTEPSGSASCHLESAKRFTECRRLLVILIGSRALDTSLLTSNDDRNASCILGSNLEKGPSPSCLLVAAIGDLRTRRPVNFEFSTAPGCDPTFRWNVAVIHCAVAFPSEPRLRS
jgi:hypothetical protein